MKSGVGSPFVAAVMTAVILSFFAIPRASMQISADPNLIAMGGEYHGTVQLKAGGRIPVKWFDFGGFIEARNERPFNRGAFPNHNWRGFISCTFTYPIIEDLQYSLSFSSSVEHESSHATMGIAEDTKNPYYMIYDNTYRRSMLNGIPLGVELFMFDEVRRFTLKGSTVFYFISKNTPELPGAETANSIGFTLGSEYRRSLGRYIGGFVSFNERFILKGYKCRYGDIFTAGENRPLIKRQIYPVINRVNTFTINAGLTFPLYEARRILDIYIRYLYGNISGYSDSRDRRSMIAFGFTVSETARP